MGSGRVAVLGGTGALGRLVWPQILEDGRAVTLLARGGQVRLAPRTRVRVHAQQSHQQAALTRSVWLGSGRQYRPCSYRLTTACPVVVGPTGSYVS